MRKYTITTGTLASSNQALTASYVTHGGVLTCSGYDQLLLLIDYTKGDETSLDFKLQFSDTSAFTDAFERSYLDTAATGISTVLAWTYTMTATGKQAIFLDVSMPYCRFQAKATAGTPTGTLNARYRLDNNER